MASAAYDRIITELQASATDQIKCARHHFAGLAGDERARIAAMLLARVEEGWWGAEQLAWLKKTLLESQATFKVLILPTPMVGPDGPVKREIGELKVELIRSSETITLRRPQTGVTATISRTAKPDSLIPLARREAKECLAEDLRRLDADEIYHEALKGIEKVQYA